MDSGRSLSTMLEDKKQKDLINFMIESNKLNNNHSKLSSPFISNQKN